MSTGQADGFLSGVIEGFYGLPWTDAERTELFDWMSAWGLNTYLYAPKDDLKHRALWREPYSAVEMAALGGLIAACRTRRLRFVYAVSPGLDIRYGLDTDLDRLHDRCAQLLGAGCEDFALLFDDIPGDLDSSDLERWGSLAAAQSAVANAVYARVRDRLGPGRRFVFCPTPYCGKMAASALGGPDYLSILGRELHAEIAIFWTGPDIISREIPVAHVQDLHRTLRRKPLIWDNLHANDYDGRRCFCGPYSGRPRALRGEVSGLLSNPNNEFPLNYVPLRTLARFVAEDGPWDARAAHLEAMREWWPRFATVGRPIAFDDLVAFIDAFYLPHEDGPEDATLLARAADLYARGAAEWGADGAALRDQAARIKDVCVRLTELRQRSLLHAFGRRLWDLREELDVLDRFLRSGGSADVRSSGTRRGGLAARLQRLRWQS